MRKCTGLFIGIVAMLLAASLQADTATDVKRRLKKYTLDYYVVYSDLDVSAMREAALRLRSMAEEYNDRMNSMGLRGTLRRRLPVFMPRTRKDYIALVGPEFAASGGLYRSHGRSGELYISGGFGDSARWHTVQHEGWHQFVDVKLGNIPLWLNEGLAEYFGHGIWTGDGLVTGVVPVRRLKRIQNLIRGEKLRPFAEFLAIESRQWLDEMGTRRSSVNYDQAWAMCHFLAHADDGKYQKAFGKFIKLVGRGAMGNRAFASIFGRDLDAFYKQFAGWWLEQDGSETEPLRTEAVVATLASFLARARVASKTYDDAAAFLAACRDRSVLLNVEAGPDIWLPESLLANAMKQIPEGGQWDLKSRPDQMLLQFTSEAGTVCRATARRAGKGRFDIRVDTVTAER